MRGQACCERNGPLKSLLVIRGRRRMNECVQDETELAFLLASILPGHELAGLGGRLPSDDARALAVLIFADRIKTLSVAEMVSFENAREERKKMEVGGDLAD